MESKLSYIKKLSKMIIRTLAELAEMVTRVEGGTETEKSGGRARPLRFLTDVFGLFPDETLDVLHVGAEALVHFHLVPYDAECVQYSGVVSLSDVTSNL